MSEDAAMGMTLKQCAAHLGERVELIPDPTLQGKIARIVRDNVCILLDGFGNEVMTNPRNIRLLPAEAAPGA
jgi:hypothetical protein